jgi:hypothetical protein
MPRVYTLSDYIPFGSIDFACTKCDRKGRYRVGNLMQSYGDEVMPIQV